jgi:hypothetical protein
MTRNFDHYYSNHADIRTQDLPNTQISSTLSFPYVDYEQEYYC